MRDQSSQHKTLDIDNDIRQADWLKRNWDLPDNIHDLRASLKRLGVSVAHFKRLPIYGWNVGKIPWLKDL